MKEKRGGTVIAIRNVTKEFDVNKQKVTALSDVNFTIKKATYLALLALVEPVNLHCYA